MDTENDLLVFRLRRMNAEQWMNVALLLGPPYYTALTSCSARAFNARQAGRSFLKTFEPRFRYQLKPMVKSKHVFTIRLMTTQTVRRHPRSSKSVAYKRVGLYIDVDDGTVQLYGSTYFRCTKREPDANYIAEVARQSGLSLEPMADYRHQDFRLDFTSTLAHRISWRVTPNEFTRNHFTRHYFTNLTEAFTCRVLKRKNIDVGERFSDWV